MNEKQNITCLDTLGVRAESVFKNSSAWINKFNLYNGWFYVRTRNKTMMDVLTNKSENLHMIFKSSSSKYQVHIHDSNEVATNWNYLDVVHVQNESKSVFIKVRKVELVNDCQPSQTYSFRQCVENYFMKVSIPYSISIYIHWSGQ